MHTTKLPFAWSTPQIFGYIYVQGEPFELIGMDANKTTVSRMIRASAVIDVIITRNPSSSIYIQFHEICIKTSTFEKDHSSYHQWSRFDKFEPHNHHGRGVITCCKFRCPHEIECQAKTCASFYCLFHIFPIWRSSSFQRENRNSRIPRATFLSIQPV